MILNEARLGKITPPMLPGVYSRQIFSAGIEHCTFISTTSICHPPTSPVPLQDTVMASWRATVAPLLRSSIARLPAIAQQCNAYVSCTVSKPTIGAQIRSMATFERKKPHINIGKSQLSIDAVSEKVIQVLTGSRNHWSRRSRKGSPPQHTLNSKSRN